MDVLGVLHAKQTSMYLIHIWTKGAVSAVKLVKALQWIFHWPFQGGASVVDRVCYLCFMLVCVVLSCLFLAALWSPAGKWLTFCLVYVCFFLCFVTFPNLSWSFIRIKGAVGVMKLIKKNSSRSILYWLFQGGISFVDHFCYLCFVFAIFLICSL